MTVYVTGDVHGGVDMQKLRDWELGDSLSGDDYLIVAGDFGFPWDFSTRSVPISPGSSRVPTPCSLSTAITSASAIGRSGPWSCGAAG